MGNEDALDFSTWPQVPRLQPPELLPGSPAKAALTVRVDLDDVEPPIWRRLRLPSDLTLDQLHEILQTAMGWDDSHLHHFVMGPGEKDLTRQYFLAPFDIAEGEDGIAERDVRLDQVLAEPGHQLFYEYDFGDSWWHTIELEAVEPCTDDHLAASCLAGERACPPEDVGGIWGFAEALDMLAGKTEGIDPEWVEQKLNWLPPGYDPASFSADEVSKALSEAVFPPMSSLNPKLANLLARAGGSWRSLVGNLMGRALADPADLSDPQVAQATLGYRTLMDTIGDGLTLTKAGYLPPGVVHELFDALGLAGQWVGRCTREDTTLPILLLRESATALGLLRKARGRLTVTAAGRKLADDPPALLRHIASRLPLGANYEKDAGLLALLFAASGDDWYAGLDVAGAMMAWMGWRVDDGVDLGRATNEWASPTVDVLNTLAGRRAGTPLRTAIARELISNADPLLSAASIQAAPLSR